uniref:Facilitated trehalose transporter Tret1-like n=1 Tax=Diabrotica virgifera virgifera TaxID=50390 RepID=A0A6P7EZX8_DIAVI
MLAEEYNTLMGAKVKMAMAVPEKEKYWAQILTILVANIAGLTEGLHFSWVSPFLVKIANDKVNYNITEEEGSYFNIVTPVAMTICTPLFARLSDRIGRKRTFLLIAIPHMLAWIIKAFATNKYHFYIARFMAGAANGCSFSVLPIYMGEISHPDIRGTWGNALPTSMFIGELLINIIGSYCGVRMTSFICMPLPILFVVLFWFMPESPYWYIMKGRYDEAKKSLKFLKRKQNVDGDFKQLREDVERQLTESGNWIDLFKIKSNRRAFVAGLFLRLTQQTSGMGVFLVYTQFIFQKSGGNVTHQMASIIYFATSLVLNLFALFFIVKRFSRKGCYIVSVSAAGVVLYIMGTYFYLDSNTNTDLSSFQWMPITSMVLHQVFLSFGISVLPTLMLGEIFTANIKSKAMTLLMIEFGLGNILMNMIFYNLNAGIGFYAPFFFFAGCCTFATIAGFYIIPETKGKTLEEIQQLLKK